MTRIVTQSLKTQLGRYGVWWSRYPVPPDVAPELERLGYGALWLGVSPDGDLAAAEELLDATTLLVVGTSIVNIWKDDPHTVAESFARLEKRHPGRFVLGVGAGHPEATTQYARPYEALAEYVDAVRADGVPRERLVVAALGPRVLKLARDHAAGAIPYLVPPEHTRQARAILGPEPLLAPEQKVVLSADTGYARSMGRERVRDPYLGLVNYTSNLRRLGYTDADLGDGGSDALIDALVAHGTADQAAARLRGHLDAGADHVAVQLLAEPGADLIPGYRALAAALGL